MRRTVQFLIPEHSSPLSHQKEQWSRWVEGAVVNQSMITPQSSICARVQGCGSSSQSRIDEPSENWFQKTSESDYETVKTKSGSSSGEFETRMYEIEKKRTSFFLRWAPEPPRRVVGTKKLYGAVHQEKPARPKVQDGPNISAAVLHMVRLFTTFGAGWTVSPTP